MCFSTSFEYVFTVSQLSKDDWPMMSIFASEKLTKLSCFIGNFSVLTIHPIYFEEKMNNLARFRRDNKLKAKTLLLLHPIERTFIARGHLIDISPANFRNGEPTDHQVALKIISMWDMFDDIAQLAY